MRFLLFFIFVSKAFAQENCSLPQSNERLVEEITPLAQAVRPNCEASMANLCRNLNPAQQVIARYPDGTLLFNPKYKLKAEDLQGENGRIYQMEHVNQENFQNNIVPVFNSLKAMIIDRMRPVSRNFPHLQNMGIEVGTRERCTRVNRPPVVASIDYEKKMVVICPLITHMNAKTLVTIIAHELGHSVDSCQFNQNPQDNRHPFHSVHACLAGNRAEQCSQPDGEDESFADNVGSAIASQYFAENARSLNYSNEPERAMLEYSHFRLASCDEEGGYGLLSPFLQPQTIQNQTACRVTNPRCSLP